MILVVHQKPRFSANYMNSLFLKTMHMILFLYISLLRRRYLRKEIGALNENYNILVIKKSFKILKDSLLLLIAEEIRVISLINRISFLNKSYYSENYI